MYVQPRMGEVRASHVAPVVTVSTATCRTDGSRGYMGHDATGNVMVTHITVVYFLYLYIELKNGENILSNVPLLILLFLIPFTFTDQVTVNKGVSGSSQCSPDSDEQVTRELMNYWRRRQARGRTRDSSIISPCRAPLPRIPR